MAADDASEPILAFSTEGSYSEIKPPAYIDWMHGYDIEINYLQENKISNRKVISQWDKIKNNNINFNRSSSVSPLLSTNWGQSFPNDDLTETIAAYNYYAPENNDNSICPTGHCKAGCVAVAMAQILRKWSAPDCPQFDWNNMPNELNFNNSNYEIQRNAIAYLISQCGLKVNMNYCEQDCFSGANYSNTLYSFIGDFGFSNAELIFASNYNSYSDWEQVLKTELENERPIFYMGTQGDYGHAYVCDGFFTTWYFSKKFHFNWGWNGVQNAYFALNDVNLPYHENILAIINLYPTNCNTSLSIAQFYKDWIPNLFYNPIAGIIYSSGVTIADTDVVHYKAFNEIILQNFETEDGAEFTAEIIPCPYSNNCDFDEINKSFLSNQFLINDTLIKEKIVNNDMDVKIFPNPSNGIFTITGISSSENSTNIRIYNMLGNIIYQSNFESNSELINISNFSNGMYFVKITMSGKIFTQKIIKK